MASTRAMLERRRSSRVAARIPLQVIRNGSHEQWTELPAEAVAVSRYGALIRVRFSPALGSRIELLHGVSKETREFRVIRVTPKDNGVYELGLEILNPARNFWGIQFPGERLSA
jgi:hypothetical protein